MLKIPTKLSHKSAQHILEYMILLILIMAGIIIGGPYVIRSWNAQMKGWEDSAIDSMNDPLAEAPIGSVPLTGCDAGSWNSGPCGPASSSVDCAGRTANCSSRYKIFTRTFSPGGCQCDVPAPMIPAISAECRQDNSFNCCADWVTPSGCTFPDGSAPGCLVPAIDCGVNSDCPDGQYRRTRNCDVDETESFCIPDSACNFGCTGLQVTGIPSLGLCPGDEVGLTGNTPYTTTDVCSPSKCEVRCNNPGYYYSLL